MTETTEAQVAAEVKTPSPTAENATEVPAATTNGHAEEQPASEQKPTEETNGTSTEDKAKSEPKEELPPPKEMRAVVLTGFGGFKNVKILKKPEPAPQTGEVLIRVKAW
ncbi:AAEL010652-PA [Aedes aegypti]|uniref:AAEL010652-PA n=1 Tax=Aedes aegypti TaxID=7159 RepID=Q16S94_AEDAE|nr:AAEL010652-PA [Aedes aegypti]